MPGREELERVVEEEFQQELTQFPQLRTRPALAYFGVGSSAMVNGELEKGVVALQKSLALDPTGALSHQVLGTAYADLGENERAIACFQRVLELDLQGVEPAIPEENPYFHMGWCYEDLGRLAEAEAAYRQSISHVPGHYQSYLWLGRLYQDRGAYAEAIATYEKALEAYLRDDPELLLLPKTSWQVGDLTSIRTNLDRARQGLPFEDLEGVNRPRGAQRAEPPEDSGGSIRLGAPDESG